MVRKRQCTYLVKHAWIEIHRSFDNFSTCMVENRQEDSAENSNHTCVSHAFGVMMWPNSKSGFISSGNRFGCSHVCVCPIIWLVGVNRRVLTWKRWALSICFRFAKWRLSDPVWGIEFYRSLVCEQLCPWVGLYNYLLSYLRIASYSSLIDSFLHLLSD